eukprot:scaffold4197_cov199-Pinguiococcus_pyrenoidosus.AAC.5
MSMVSDCASRSKLVTSTVKTYSIAGSRSCSTRDVLPPAAAVEFAVKHLVPAVGAAEGAAEGEPLGAFELSTSVLLMQM